MQGKRVYPDCEGDIFLKEGDYAFLSVEKIWVGKSPNGHCCNLGNHTITEHEDGSITVTPSILINDAPGHSVYHGFLERGIWRDA